MIKTEGDLTRLRRLVKDLTLELLDDGGTSPRATCDLIAEVAPDLWTRFGRARILSLCEEVQYSEIPEDSARLQELFRTFNQKYFDGTLSDFAICAVYDANFWQDSESGEQSAGFVDFDRQLIIIGYTGRRFWTDHASPFHDSRCPSRVVCNELPRGTISGGTGARARAGRSC
jgi:hypothetical protein